jgi:hypothetical protein
MSKTTALATQAAAQFEVMTPLEECLVDFGLQHATTDELLDAGLVALNKSMYHACQAGVVFWRVREQLNTDCDKSQSGNLKDWIVKNGISERRVYECIKLAKFYARLPAPERAKLHKLSLRKAILLSAASQDVIDKAAEGGQDLLDEAELMSYHDLRKVVEGLRGENASAEHRIEVLEKQLSRPDPATVRGSDYNAQTLMVRDECMAYLTSLTLSLDGIRRVFDKVCQTPQAPEFNLQIEQLWLTACMMHAKASTVVSSLAEESPLPSLPEVVRPVHTLTAEESAHWLSEEKMLRAQWSGQEAGRAINRAATLADEPRGRGRPSKLDAQARQVAQAAKAKTVG